MSKSSRDTFLIEMYSQLMNDINRHIIVVWQSIATLVAAIAALGLVEKGVIPLSIAVSLILLVATWLLLHVIDASYWYNRNLAMIANIERQFLKDTDKNEIHYYFTKHRPNNAMISHLKIQRLLALAVAALVLVFHFTVDILPAIQNSCIFELSILNLFPYIIALLSTLYCIKFQGKKNNNYLEFLANSPGREMDETGIEFGSGHGFSN
jgi:hypothetical protein